MNKRYKVWRGTGKGAFACILLMALTIVACSTDPSPEVTAEATSAEADDGSTCDTENQTTTLLYGDASSSEVDSENAGDAASDGDSSNPNGLDTEADNPAEVSSDSDQALGITSGSYGAFDGYDEYGNGYTLVDEIRYFDATCPYTLNQPVEEAGVVTWYQEGTDHPGNIAAATELLRAYYKEWAASYQYESFSLAVSGGLDAGPCVGVYDGHIIFHGTMTGTATLPNGRTSGQNLGTTTDSDSLD